MSKKVSPQFIGFFVIGAIVLVVLGLMIFGGGEFLQRKSRYVMFFEGAMSGLSEGSPVEYRGVKVGKVYEIKMCVSKNIQDIIIPVIVDLFPENIVGIGKFNIQKFINLAIGEGLKAQLVSANLITGQRKIELIFDKNMKPVYRNDGTIRYLEIPTISSKIARFFEKLESLSVDEIFAESLNAVKGISSLVNAPETKEAFLSLNKTMEEIKLLVVNLNNMVGQQSPMRFELMKLLREFSQAARSLKTLADSLERKPESLLYGKD